MYAKSKKFNDWECDNYEVKPSRQDDCQKSIKWLYSELVDAFSVKYPSLKGIIKENHNL